MPILVWDKLGERTYESGLDKGVLFLPDGSGVPWNGLTSVIENFDKEVSPVYYDGKKVHNLVALGDFSATMKAITYPDEFTEIEGLSPLRNGMYLGDQKPQVFGLCYRTRIGDDINGDVAGYKIHILFNVTAIPSQKEYATISDDPSLVEFEWQLFAVPEEVSGFRPTSHFIIDSRDFDPLLLEDLEAMLYGSILETATLLPMSELVAYIREWYRVKIVDNGDGSWTATSVRDSFIQVLNDDGLFQIIEVNAVYLNEDEFQLSDTLDISDVPHIKIVNNGDGTWTATTSQDDLIVMTTPDTFELLNANATYLDADTFVLQDTTGTD